MSFNDFYSLSNNLYYPANYCVQQQPGAQLPLYNTQSCVLQPPLAPQLYGYQHHMQPYGVYYYEAPQYQQPFYGSQCYVQPPCATSLCPGAPQQQQQHSEDRYYVETPDGSVIDNVTQYQEQPPSPSASSSSTPTRFRGIRELSQKGIHKVVHVPTSLLTSAKLRQDTFTYRCMQCKKVNKYTTVLVNGDDFLEDPVTLRHSCIPIERTKDKASRISYECLQQIRRDEDAAMLPTVKYFLNVIDN